MVNYWIFQGNPDRFDVRGYLLSGLERITWKVKRYNNQIREGDKVFIWISAGRDKGNSGIIAVGEIDSSVWIGEDHKEARQFWVVDSEANEETKRVWIKLKRVLGTHRILKKTELMNDLILKDLPVIRQPQGTNYHLSSKEGGCLGKLVRNWNDEELILALRTYREIPFGQINHSNPRLIDLGKLIGRKPSAVSMKLSNFASLDPEHEKRGVKGLSNASNNDRLIWEKYHNNLEEFAYDSARVEAEALGKSFEESDYEPPQSLDPFYPSGWKGTDKERVIRTRENQRLFRKAVLFAYNSSCCITGLCIEKLLIASHIVPWSKDKENRLNPRNGLCLNAFHDKAFDTGLLTVTPDFKVQISESVKVSENGAVGDLLLKFNNQKINLPHRFHPYSEFLKYHNDHIFRH